MAIADQYLTNNPTDELVAYMQSSTAALLHDTSKQIRYFLQFLNFHETIGEKEFINLARFIRNNVDAAEQEQKAEIVSFVESAQYVKPVYKQILQLFCLVILKVKDYSEEHISQLLFETRQNIEQANEALCLQLSYVYVFAGKLEDARELIKSYINVDKFDESYILYCKVLYQLPTGDKYELLSLLKRHREQFEIDYVLLQIELELTRLQGKTKDYVKLAKKGHHLFPESEYFIHQLFSSLDLDLQTDEIKSIGPGLSLFPFKEEQTVVLVAKNLIKVELYSTAIELLFKYASESANTIVRQAFFMLSHTFPSGSMKEFEEVRAGSHIKYEISRESKIIEITEDNKDKHPYKLFLGKKVGETIALQKPFGQSIEFVKITRIMDKYLALFEQIMQDADDSLSNMPIRRLEFKGDTIEAMHATFIEAFGAVGSLHQAYARNELEKYFKGTSSFGDVTNSVFKQDFTDSYFILTNNDGKPFRAISPAFGHSNFTEQSQFVLDPTSLCLFYLLERESELVFKQKFIISPFLGQHIVEALERTKTEEYKVSITITMDGVIPHVYDDQFKNRRINTFEGLLTWLDANCVVTEVPERLEFLSVLVQERKNELFLNIYLDNRLLIDRQDHFLLTNDLMYIRNFGADRNAAISPVCYLRIFQSEKQKEFTSHFLRHYYVGVPITASVMNEEFFKMLAGQDNRFTTCLENLKFNWNPDVKNIGEAIQFIKKMYTDSVIGDRTRTQWSSAVLHALTTGMDDRLLNIVEKIIHREFRLLGLYQAQVLAIYAQVTGR